MAPVAKSVAATILGAAVLIDQFNGVVTMDAGAGVLGLHGAGAIGMVATAWICLVSHRGWLAVETVIDTIENKTVEAVEVIGDHVITSISDLYRPCYHVVLRPGPEVCHEALVRFQKIIDAP